MLSSKVALFQALIISYLIFFTAGNFTRISRSNAILSRRKRYLTFPKGSNLVMTMSAVKALFQVQPRGYNCLWEVDVPFALPSDTKFFTEKKKHKKDRRSIYSQLDAALTEGGVNGKACVNRIICDAQQYIPFKGRSLVKDLLLAIFTSDSESDTVYGGPCDKNGWAECEYPLLEYILNSIETPNNQL